MKNYFLFFSCLFFLSGCATKLQPNDWESRILLEPVVALPSFSSTILLSCVNDMQNLDQNEFETKFGLAKENLVHNSKLDELLFICLSLNEKANTEQLRHGKQILEQFVRDHPKAGEDMLGLLFLSKRLNYLVNQLEKKKIELKQEKKQGLRTSRALKEKKEKLQSEIKSLEIKTAEQQKQLEQLKNIERIIKSRETEQP